MERGRKESRGIDIIEKVATKKVLALSIATLAFGFSFLSSGIPAGEVPREESVGAADLADAQDPGADPSLLGDLEPPPPDQGLFYVVYRVVKGDTISEIADRYGVTTDSVVTFNGIVNARALSIGKYLKIPTLNGILYTSKEGDTAAALAASYGISADRIRELNGIGEEPVEKGSRLFLPDARLSSWALREISGDLFSWPIRGWITSWYGWRDDPFSGDRSFHTGIDIGSSRGRPVHAAMEGVVAATGYSATSGNYVSIRHHSGYSTLYAHLDRIDVKAGRSVTQSTVIGAVGSTGYSNGPHLHFTVSKNGRTMNPMTVLR
ncbi:MAG: M23 family metallopeptidase [Spirochaetes bacterium]|nr:M23 family metallopeptidase [Spirochaetota bacterium]MBU1080045.1 M23 family metallopeptidase [Spirochaetota bacterium]